MQSAFVTLFICLSEAGEYIEEMVQITEEILKQRIEGVKNEQGVAYTIAFPN